MFVRIFIFTFRRKAEMKNLKIFNYFHVDIWRRKVFLLSGETLCLYADRVTSDSYFMRWWNEECLRFSLEKLKFRRNQENLQLLIFKVSSFVGKYFITITKTKLFSSASKNKKMFQSNFIIKFVFLKFSIYCDNFKSEFSRFLQLEGLWMHVYELSK